MAFSVRHHVYSCPPGVVIRYDAGVHAGRVHHVPEVVLERAVHRSITANSFRWKSPRKMRSSVPEPGRPVQRGPFVRLQLPVNGPGPPYPVFRRMPRTLPAEAASSSPCARTPLHDVADSDFLRPLGKSDCHCSIRPLFPTRRTPVRKLHPVACWILGSPLLAATGPLHRL